MKYSKGFMLQVKRCHRESFSPIVPSETGFAQFYEYESRGKKPQFPDPFFTTLVDGKAWLEWKINFIADQYFTPDWPGFMSLESDFKDDPQQVEMVRARIKQRKKTE